MFKTLCIVILLFAGNIALAQENDNFIETLLKEDTSQLVYQVLFNPSKYKLQIAYTRVDKNDNHNVKFKTWYYGVGEDHYFYPASLVKLPVSAFALEKILLLSGSGVKSSTPLSTKASCTPSDTLYVTSTVEQDVKEMLVLSENYPFNQLYEFVGPDYINSRLKSMGYETAYIYQPLRSCEPGENRTTGPYFFSNKIDSLRRDTIYKEVQKVSPENIGNNFNDRLVGKAWIDGSKRIKKPKDFTYSNAIRLSDMQQILLSLIYPETVPEKKRFKITGKDYETLRTYMSIYPREAGYQDESNYYDAARKYLLLGNRVIRADSNIRIFNKVGLAYGFVSDCAYIVDYTNNVEFFLSAVIYTNDCEIVGGGKYEYTSIAFPFMEQIGKIFYQYELQNHKQDCVNPPLSYK